MSIQLTEPVLVIGVGGAGSKLAPEVKKSLNADCLLISNDEKDLKRDCSSIKISTNSVVNPSINLLRGFTNTVADEINEKISPYSTVVLVANLAGKAGSAIAPVISGICKGASKSIISFAIMPFKYEKERIFSSGISLKYLRDNSNCTIVIDNDALLENNPDLTLTRCYEVANTALLYIADSLKKSTISEDTKIISTSGSKTDLESSLKDSMKMLYSSAFPNKIKHSMVHILGGKDVPVGLIDSISTLTSGALKEENQMGVSTGSEGETKIIMLSSIMGETKFDKYDPLNFIPKENTLDWNEPESSIDCKLDLYQLE